MVNKQTVKHPPCKPGRNLKSLRAAQKLTLDQLSRLAGVSKAMLSQIEQDKVNPTVAVMLRIASALKVTISDLLDVPGPHNIIKVIRANNDLHTFRSDDACHVRTLSPLGLEKNVEFYRIKLESGGEMASEPHFPGTEELLYLARGCLQIVSGGQEAQLHKGDSIHYRADIPHTLKNAGKGICEVFIVVRYRED